MKRKGMKEGYSYTLGLGVVFIEERFSYRNDFQNRPNRYCKRTIIEYHNTALKKTTNTASICMSAS